MFKLDTCSGTKPNPTSSLDLTWRNTETGQIIGGNASGMCFEKNPYLESKPTMAAYWIEEGNILFFFHSTSPHAEKLHEKARAFRSIADSPYWTTSWPGRPQPNEPTTYAWVSLQNPLGDGKLKLSRWTCYSCHCGAVTHSEQNAVVEQVCW